MKEFLGFVIFWVRKGYISTSSNMTVAQVAALFYLKYLGNFKALKDAVEVRATYLMMNISKNQNLGLTADAYNGKAVEKLWEYGDNLIIVHGERWYDTLITEQHDQVEAIALQMQLLGKVEPVENF